MGELKGGSGQGEWRGEGWLQNSVVNRCTAVDVHFTLQGVNAVTAVTVQPDTHSATRCDLMSLSLESSVISTHMI